MSEATSQHREAAPEGVRIAVVTVSDTRTPETDTGGDTAQEAFEAAGHEVVYRGIVRDEADLIRREIETLLARDDVDAAVTTGGTGISARDTTFEVVGRMLHKELPGFGELFRMLSYDEVGAAAMLSRATAGSVGSKFLACLPGSRAAVRLAAEKLLAPEVSHVVFELKKHGEVG